jgi:hypothetical protein
MRRDQFRPSAGRLAALIAAFLLSTASFLAVGVPDAKPSASKPCWELVMDDWLDNSRIDGLYSLGCLQTALERAPEDIRAYSDFEDKVEIARQAVAREPQGAGPPPVVPPPGAAARTVPIPLIVLAAFAGTLLVAGGVEVGRKKLAELRERRPRR